MTRFAFPRRGVAAAVLLALLTLTVAACADSTGPKRDRMTARLNGERRSMNGTATVIRRDGAPDSVVFAGRDVDLAIEVKVQYTGSGSYVLGPDNIWLAYLVGGDVVGGVYRGVAGNSGNLQITVGDGPSPLIQAEFSFDGVFVSGYQAFGPTVALRNGFLYGPLQ